MNNDDGIALGSTKHPTPRGPLAFVRSLWRRRFFDFRKDSVETIWIEIPDSPERGKRILLVNRSRNT